MAWTEDTPEYREGYLSFPRITGGPGWGLWLFVNEKLQINVANILSWEHTDKRGWYVVTANGEYHVPTDLKRQWDRLTIPSPQDAEQMHRRSLGIAVPQGGLIGG